MSKFTDIDQIHQTRHAFLLISYEIIFSSIVGIIVDKPYVAPNI